MQHAKLFLLLVIFITSPVIAHDTPDDPREVVTIRHYSYILGMQASLASTGATPYEQMLINDFFSRWNEAVRDSKARRQGLSDLEYFRVYTASLKKHGIQCGHPLWTDTFTNEFCE